MNFWKSFSASLLATAVGIIVLVFVVIGSLGSLATLFETEQPTVPSQSVLYIDLAEDIVDAPLLSPLGVFDPSSMEFYAPITMLEALAAIENAATDDNIKGICINIDGAGVVETANLEELRAAIARFKLSGKFVVAYDDNYTEGEYYLASVADQVLLNPEGSLEWHGLGMSSMFYKGLLNKLDVEVEVFRPTDCKYKSGVEPFILTKMSDANRKQMQSLVDSMWQTICSDVSASRGVDVELLKRYARDLSITLPEDALNAHLIDAIAYEDELFALYDSYGVKRNDMGLHSTLSLGEYVTMVNVAPLSASVGDNTMIKGSDKSLVAIIYADGEIVDGNMYMDGSVFGTRLAEELRQARLSDETKAVVVRVNSPGGSALASEVAWREMELLQQVKPVVVSMGSMAASGGYYISAPADYIIADRLTLTGSIGVFGVLFNLENTFKNKLGITFDTAATSPTAGGMNMMRSLTPTERKALERSIDRVYATFTSHVAEGRNLPLEDVLNIAEGRVWSGTEALECGLVDALGGFNEAIGKAIELADLKGDYALYEFRAPLTPFEEWLDSMGMLYAKSWGIDYNIYGDAIREVLEENPIIMKNSGIQALVPGNLKVNL
ncbi:MAG: signal peptide peptidase SppA [Alistipes sp.]|nr:signal peptide peptidase SppA [Alistipes sp.]